MRRVLVLLLSLLAFDALAGSALPTNWLQLVIVKPSSGSLNAGEVYRSMVTNTGAGAGIELELPAASVGMNFEVCTNAPFAISLDPAGAEVITAQAPATLASGDKITSPGSLGACVRLVGVGAGTWAMVSVTGTWTDGGP